MNRDKKHIEKEKLLEMYRLALLIRRFEEMGLELFEAGKIRGYFHTSIGQEAVAVGACAAIQRDDYIVSSHRCHAHSLAKGADPAGMFADLLGRAEGYSRARGGSMHIIDPENNNIGGNGIVGGGIPIGCGVAMGVKLESSDSVVLCFMGDGAANNGVFGESLNLAVIYNLPVIFIVENNEFAGTTPMRQSTGVEHLAKRAEGYGLPGMTVFGNDVLEMHKHVSSAVSRARAGSGPTLIEARTYRHHGHHARDKGEYMPDSHVREWKASDPIGIIEQHLNYLKTSKADMKVVENDVENTIRSAVAFGENAKQPDIDSFLQKIHRLYA